MAAETAYKRAGRTDKAQNVFPPCSDDPLVRGEGRSRGKGRQMRLSDSKKNILTPYRETSSPEPGKE